MQIEVKLEGGGPDDEVEILEVFVEVGQTIAQDDVLLEVATDKANMEVIAPAAGRVSALPAQVGETFAGDAVLAVIETA